jgi:hypothetical protein
MENRTSWSYLRHGADSGEGERICKNTQGSANKLQEQQGSSDPAKSQRDLLTVKKEVLGSGERCAGTDISHGRTTSGDLYCEREGIKVRILDSHLWMSFNEIQTEMIINRGGRFVDLLNQVYIKRFKTIETVFLIQLQSNVRFITNGNEILDSHFSLVKLKAKICV